jgi:hypothetical protein
MDKQGHLLADKTTTAAITDVPPLRFILQNLDMTMVLPVLPILPLVAALDFQAGEKGSIP